MAASGFKILLLGSGNTLSGRVYSYQEVLRNQASGSIRLGSSPLQEKTRERWNLLHFECYLKKLAGKFFFGKNTPPLEKSDGKFILRQNLEYIINM